MWNERTDTSVAHTEEEKIWGCHFGKKSLVETCFPPARRRRAFSSEIEDQRWEGNGKKWLNFRGNWAWQRGSAETIGGVCRKDRLPRGGYPSSCRAPFSLDE
jgi:hypothetical protein